MRLLQLFSSVTLLAAVAEACVRIRFEERPDPFGRYSMRTVNVFLYDNDDTYLTTSYVRDAAHADTLTLTREDGRQYYIDVAKHKLPDSTELARDGPINYGTSAGNWGQLRSAARRVVDLGNYNVGFNECVTDDFDNCDENRWPCGV